MNEETKKVKARVSELSVLAETALMEAEPNPALRHMATLELLCRLCQVYGPDAGPKVAKEIIAAVRRAQPAMVAPVGSA